MKLGLWDSQDNCWLGNEDGPLAYEDLELARLSQEVVRVRLRWAMGRIKVQPLDPMATKRKDELEYKLSTEEALRRLEEGME